MGVKAFLSRWIGGAPARQKGIDIGRVIQYMLSRGRIGKDYQGRAVDGYLGNHVVYRAVRQLAVAVAQVDWLLFRDTRDGEREEVDNHPILETIRRPSPYFGRARFMEQLISYLLIAGKNFILRIDGRRPELRNLRPDKTKAVLNSTGTEVLRWVVNPDTPQEVNYEPEDILPLFLFHPASEWDGTSPIVPSTSVVDQSNLTREWNTTLIQNQARPPGVLSFEEAMQDILPEDEAEILAKFREKYQGTDNAGEPILLKGGLQWKPMALTPTELDWLDGQAAADRGIAVAFGVPPQTVGDTQSQTFSNYREARKALYEDEVVPLLEWIASELNRWLVEPYGADLQLHPNFDSISALQENTTEKAERVQQSDWLTLGEKRRATGYEEMGTDADRLIVTRGNVVILPDGKILVPATLLPTEDIGLEAAGTPASQGQDGDESQAPQDEEEKAEPCFKAINLLSREAKAAHWKAVDRERIGFERWAGGMARKLFAQQGGSLVTAVRDAPDATQAGLAADTFLRTAQDEWKRLYERIYVAVALHFARRVTQSLPKGLEVAPWMAVLSAPDGKQDEDDISNFTRAIRAYIEQEAGQKIKGIVETTRQYVRQALAEGLEAGEGIDTIAKRLDSVLEQTYKNRSEVVARTEIINASNLGSDVAAKATGVVKRKEWISVPDARTREPHSAADGQVVEADQPFVVNGQELMWPGDTSLGASAANVIQCRCTVGYLTE